MKPPPLRDDCFAMPPGVDWTPVDDALERLRGALSPVVGTETVPVEQALGRVLARDAVAARANPPAANAAVDGYGFAFDSLPVGEVLTVPLAEGRAAAGDPLDTEVRFGKAMRILTGAALPPGVDTVVLEEDCSVTPDKIAFRSGIRKGANTRPMGEDVGADTVALPQGSRLRPQDLALLSAIGLAGVEVFAPLRVGVLSTGNEVVAPGTDAGPHQIHDANRPMLLSLLASWGCTPVDLGHVPDEPDTLRDALLTGKDRCDAILTSGGASASEEDHMPRVLRDIGRLDTWRVAVKPGRPIAMAMVDGRPVFGLPGNPVAAFVCTLIFAAPALQVLAGRSWQAPEAVLVPASFSKSKKPGRREYLRARLRDGKAEVFRSEGSGRISGLSWAEGLVELSDDAQEITPGTLVRYLPFGAFG